MCNVLQINLSERPNILWAGSDGFTDLNGASFQLKDIWSLHYYKYSGRIIHNDVEVEIRPGSIGVCQPYANIVYDSFCDGPREHLAFNFCLPEAHGDYLWEVPMMVSQDGHDLEDALSRFERIIRLYSDVELNEPMPLPPEIELWALLLAIAQKSGPQRETSAVESQGRRLVRSALKMIDTHLSEDIYAEKIAKQLDISVSHLGGLFNKYAGCPVATLIRRKRLRYAHRQLSYSNEPIRKIAADVGISDLANFNRFIRREFGLSPKQIRGRQREGFSVREMD
ncbi:helix-turn-helix domain-containing protein [Coraliomargarita akajimensis]|uniref:Transcriptional regulator, AraC family n=1 Tax=Coraliomargarita akajimensis (strain DSM 45221 / IAM 15411 / JCM 23193 / KCTC 12865 / 04OKA010-24) TaxID=583355 RepID=D5EL60_CORAD|nr:AraC family transcriptional regulator [Coraliomargarita akajimensis]ADE53162.1 transcriptional regulator, AraC family [Coraliomargarita akajimensis DSM 45221]